MIERQGARGHCLSWLKASAILYGCSVGCLALRTFPGIRLPFTSRRSIILRFRRMKNTEIAATTSSFRDPPLSIVQHNSTRKERFFFWNFPIPREIPCFPSISELSPIYTVDRYQRREDPPLERKLIKIHIAHINEGESIFIAVGLDGFSRGTIQSPCPDGIWVKGRWKGIRISGTSR